MNTMKNIPGFAAEASLYVSPSHYRNASTGGQAHTLSPVVSPALVGCDNPCFES